MKDFLQWLTEKQTRTHLNGLYPDLYSSAGGYPPLANASQTAGHMQAYAKGPLGLVHKNLLSKSVKKELEKNKGKIPRMLSKNPWKKSFNQTKT